MRRRVRATSGGWASGEAVESVDPGTLDAAAVIAGSGAVVRRRLPVPVVGRWADGPASQRLEVLSRFTRLAIRGRWARIPAVAS